MNFRQELEEDTVGALPIREAIIVQPHSLVRAAVAMMRSQSLGCAVIVGDGRRPSGIFTEHSVIEVLNQNACLDDVPVCQYADPNFIEVNQSEPIMRIWNAIRSAAVRFVCVTDDEGRILGVTGQRGLSEYLADCFARQMTVQRLGSTPLLVQREGA